MTTAKARTAGDFAAAHQRKVRGPNKIRDALAAMLKVGNEHWLYETELTQQFGIAQVDLAEFRDHFAKHWTLTEPMHGQKPRRVWFADSKVAAKFRQE